MVRRSLGAAAVMSTALSSPIVTWRARPSLETLLTERFGIAAFRPWQREAIEALLGGSRHVLVVAPTGGGKSLCYQLPALALDGTTLVLSPLISLMEDQVRALEARGIPATFIASSLPREENSRRLSGLRRGAYKLVYAAPERLAFDGFLDALAASRLALVAVDEAHCIVQWGHDFRPDYLRIGDALERLEPPRVLACTATATPYARREIILRLGWQLPQEEDDPWGDSEEGTRERGGPITAGDIPPARGQRPIPKVVLRGFARPNLHLQVREVDGPREARKRVADALAEALRDRRRPRGAGIVYAATRKAAETIAEALRDAGWGAEAYHAGLPAEARARISGAFADRSLSIVVATNAFGMGIDRPDVRVVVHAQPPSSIEAYYQEVGRAGRDGEPASGLLLFAPSDIALRRRLCELGQDGTAAPPEDAARAWRLFRELLRYVDAATCRHDFILRYFGDEAESLGGCGHCDICEDVNALSISDPDALARDADLIRRALAGVARAKGSAGMQLIASMLVGEPSDRLRRLGLQQLSTFGVLAGKTHADAMAILRVLLGSGWIDLTPTEYPVPKITPAGWRVMRGDVPARVRLPVAPIRKEKRRAAPRPPPRQPAAAGRRGVPPQPPASLHDAAAAGRRGPPPQAPAALHDAAAAMPSPRRAEARREPSLARRGGGAKPERPAQAEPPTAAEALEERDFPLFDALRTHRAALAKQNAVPPYVIAHDRTLRDIARLRPTSPEDLELARGMGPVKIAKYGEGFLSVVRQFADDNGRQEGR